MASPASVLTNYDPGQVMLQTPTMGQEQRPSSTPYVPTSSSPTLGAEAVRATGQGPFDAAYRQNLATFAGGQVYRPGGYLGFNPTGNQMFGDPTGGGSAPIPGASQSLMNYAVGGQPFSWAPQTSTTPATTTLGSPYVGAYGGGGGSDDTLQSGSRLKAVF